MSRHDEIRHLTRFGRDANGATGGDARTQATDLEVGTRRARAAILLTLALPGGAYLYQGELLGLPEVEDLPRSVLPLLSSAELGPSYVLGPDTATWADSRRR